MCPPHTCCDTAVSPPPVVQYVLKPTFTAQQIGNLDKQAKLSRAYDGTTYLPGIVGLNNIKANDYANAVLQVWVYGGGDLGVRGGGKKHLWVPYPHRAPPPGSVQRPTAAELLLGGG